MIFEFFFFPRIFSASRKRWNVNERAQLVPVSSLLFACSPECENWQKPSGGGGTGESNEACDYQVTRTCKNRARAKNQNKNKNSSSFFIYLKKNKSMEMNQKKKSPKFRLEILRNFLVNKKKNANTTMTCSISGRLIIITSRRAIPKWSWSDWLILVVILKKKNRRKWFACNLFVRCLSRYKVIFRFVKNCENCCGKFHEFHAASIYSSVEARVWYHFIHATSYGYPLDYLDT